MSPRAFFAGLFLCICGTAMATRMTFEGVSCQSPRNGLWKIELLEPPEDPALVVTGYLLLRYNFKNTYSGTAELYPVDTAWTITMDLMGMFEADHCSLYGVMVNHELSVVDEFKWSCNGDWMKGIFMASVTGNMEYEDYSIHKLELLEQTDETDLRTAIRNYYRKTEA